MTHDDDDLDPENSGEFFDKCVDEMMDEEEESEDSLDSIDEDEEDLSFDDDEAGEDFDDFEDDEDPLEGDDPDDEDELDLKKNPDTYDSRLSELNAWLRARGKPPIEDEDEEESILRQHYNPCHRGMNPAKKWEEYGKLEKIISKFVETRKKIRSSGPTIKKLLLDNILVGIRFSKRTYTKYVDDTKQDFYLVMYDYPMIVKYLRNIPEDVRRKKDRIDDEEKIEVRQDFGGLIILSDDDYYYYPQVDPDFFSEQMLKGNVTYYKLEGGSSIDMMIVPKQEEKRKQAYMNPSHPWRPHGPRKSKGIVAILFSKKHFSKEEAERWLQSHGYRSVVYETDGFYDAPQMKKVEVEKHKGHIRTKELPIPGVLLRFVPVQEMNNNPKKEKTKKKQISCESCSREFYESDVPGDVTKKHIKIYGNLCPYCWSRLLGSRTPTGSP